MRLNRINLEKEEEDDKDDYEEKEEEEVEDEEKGEADEQQDKEGGDEEDEEENDQEDNNQGKMIGDSDLGKSKKKSFKIPNIKDITKIKHNKSLIKKIILIICIIIAFILFLKLIFFIVGKIRNKSTPTNSQASIFGALNPTKMTKVKEYFNEQYNSNLEINLNKFQKETIEQRQYGSPDPGLTQIHISTSFSENCTNEIIIHLSSILKQMSSSSFIHFHLMNVGNFNLETFSKLINMVQKINNNSEIIVYNAQQALKDFKIRDDKLTQFNKEYARLYALKAIKGVQKLIMLNIDTIMAEKDLGELYNLDMNEIYARGVTEVPYIRYKVEWMDEYLYDKSHFINGDVLLINLDLCQREEIYNKAIELNNHKFYHNVEDPVQDILNVVLKKKIEFLEVKYNKINFYENPEDKNDENRWYPWVAEAMKYSEKNNHFYSKTDLLTADGDPVITNYVWEKQLSKKPKKYQEQKEMLAKLNGF